jgi:hypothetical protein
VNVKQFKNCGGGGRDFPLFLIIKSVESKKTFAAVPDRRTSKHESARQTATSTGTRAADMAGGNDWTKEQEV